MSEKSMVAHRDSEHAERVEEQQQNDVDVTHAMLKSDCKSRDRNEGRHEDTNASNDLYGSSRRFAHVVSHVLET
jgi:hypothetical protein